MPITHIRKRDGRDEPFDRAKIARAVQGAMRELGSEDPERAEGLADRVVELLDAEPEGAPTVEHVQDLVERALIEARDPELAKAYILHRFRHASLREAKTVFGVQDDLKLPLNAIHVLEKRYLRKDEDGKVAETPSGMFRRVAAAVAAVDERYEGKAAAEASAERFYQLMASLDFLPNSPTLMNAGTSLGQLSACFVLPVEDSMDGIFSALRCMAFIHQSGGGTGFSFSQLRPRGDVVRSTGGVASGPVSFIEVFDKATDVIKQGGRRRGANMAILNVEHADAVDFILCKTRPRYLENFNISVAVTDPFMEAVESGGMHVFRNPRSGKETARRPAREVFDLICSAAWQCGDPGLVFIDEINRRNPLIDVARIAATNPCGEQPLLPYESCNLGSINLSRFVTKGGFDYERLGEVVDEAVHFLDNVIDANRHPLPEVEKATLASRKIGLGVMGFSDALYEMDVPYDSEGALELADEVFRFVRESGRAMSVRLGERRGSFPLFERSAWRAEGCRALRNATVTTVAPTGTIGLIAGVSSGIEPVFALRYWRTMAEGTVLFETHREFARRAEALGADLEALFAGCAREGSIRSCEQLPEAMRRVFVVARDISPEWHVRMQAAFQKHSDNGVSKTVNLPRQATVEDVRAAYLLAWRLKCKGITVYREGSRGEDVLRSGPRLSRFASMPHLNAESCDPSDSEGCRRCPG
jgi:ribonucleoside-diphosphate reductase alpha chain